MWLGAALGFSSWPYSGPPMGPGGAPASGLAKPLVDDVIAAVVLVRSGASRWGYGATLTFCEGGHQALGRFPAAFRPPALASWSSCARWGAGPSLRSAYRSCCQGRTPTGLPRSARMSCGRGGCPLYPGTAVPARPAGHPRPPHAALQRPVPVPPSSNPPPEASYHEASSRVHGCSPVRPSPGL